MGSVRGKARRTVNEVSESAWKKRRRERGQRREVFRQMYRANPGRPNRKRQAVVEVEKYHQHFDVPTLFPKISQR